MAVEAMAEAMVGAMVEGAMAVEAMAEAREAAMAEATAAARAGEMAAVWVVEAKAEVI